MSVDEKVPHGSTGLREWEMEFLEGEELPHTPYRGLMELIIDGECWSLVVARCHANFGALCNER